VRYEHGRRVCVRERVCVRPGGCKTWNAKSASRHYRHEDRQVLVTSGHYETKCERVCVREGYWQTGENDRPRVERERLSIGFDFRGRF